MCDIRSSLPHRSHCHFLRRTSWTCTRPSLWFAVRVNALRSRAFIHGSRPLQWTSWQHIWPTCHNRPASNKKTRNCGKRSGNNAAIAFFARQTFVALDGVLTSGSFDTTRPAPNLAYADLLELQELACDVLLHRDTSERRNHPIFEQLSIFAKDGTSSFSAAFGQWRLRYEEWQEASARTWGYLSHPHEDRLLATDLGRQCRRSNQSPPLLLLPHCYC